MKNENLCLKKEAAAAFGLSVPDINSLLRRKGAPRVIKKNHSGNFYDKQQLIDFIKRQIKVDLEIKIDPDKTICCYMGERKIVSEWGRKLKVKKEKLANLIARYGAIALSDGFARSNDVKWMDRQAKKTKLNYNIKCLGE